MGALVDFLGNFVRSRFMFGLGIAHGGIAEMIIDTSMKMQFQVFSFRHSHFIIENIENSFYFWNRWLVD